MLVLAHDTNVLIGAVTATIKAAAFGMRSPIFLTGLLPIRPDGERLGLDWLHYFDGDWLKFTSISASLDGPLSQRGPSSWMCILGNSSILRFTRYLES